MGTFSENLDAILRQRNLTGEWLSTQTGIDASDISKYRKGKKTCGLESMRNIARALGVGVVALDESLLCGEIPIGADKNPDMMIKVPLELSYDDAEDILRWYAAHKQERRDFLAKIGQEEKHSSEEAGLANRAIA